METEEDLNLFKNTNASKAAPKPVANDDEFDFDF